MLKMLSEHFTTRRSFRSSSPSIHISNLSSCCPVSIRAFAEHFWNHWNATGDLLFGEIPYRSGEVMRYVAGDNLLKVGNPF